MYGWIHGGGGGGAGGSNLPPPHIDSDRLVCALISCDLSIWYFLCVKKNKVNVLLPDLFVRNSIQKSGINGRFS